MPGPHCYVNTKELEIDEMKEIKDYFVLSAARQKEWGFDGVEIKIAHDGLLRSFVSPYLNRRTDAYGGSYENRVRFPLEIITAIRMEVGNGYPIGIRLCMDEFTDWGYSLDYGLKLAKTLEEAGVTYINSDAGTFSNYVMEIPNSYIPLGFAVYMSAALKKTVDIPVVAFGRINDPVQAETILAEGNADLIGMCRQLICDPKTPSKTMEGRLDDIRHCIACSEGCGMVNTQEGVVCVQNPAAGREKRMGIGTLGQCEKKKKIMIAGAGIAGLKTAEICKKRGHDVAVYEKTDRVGGQLLLAEKIPYRVEISEVYRYLKLQLQRLGVPIYYNCEVDTALVESENPDCVVAATGSRAALPDYKGAAESSVHVIDCRSALTEIEKIGQNVLVVDDTGYWQALGVADYIASIGSKVTVLTSRLYAGVDLEETCREILMKRLYRADTVFINSHVLKEIRHTAVVLENKFNHAEKTVEGIDTIVVAQASYSDDGLYKTLKKANRDVFSVGDCVAPRTILQIIFEAEELGRKI
jgi:thioredoxin reductase